MYWYVWLPEGLVTMSGFYPVSRATAALKVDLCSTDNQRDTLVVE